MFCVLQITHLIVVKQMWISEHPRCQKTRLCEPLHVETPTDIQLRNYLVQHGIQKRKLKTVMERLTARRLPSEKNNNSKCLEDFVNKQAMCTFKGWLKGDQLFLFLSVRN